ncbi:MAG TPA: RidA family protein [Candidatus Saccharicenans sp.]|nr:RidA family protein [Candidatus Saccharicenans sp.]HOJ26133.1 RidA family protein [Candidatus Saccharicenans sp.]HOL44926.1 RidA family protein [Candidatus Saccharicenans sp.]HOM93923.1 RidA family protein [Candidatus Saccharicenans sp.]HOT69532.1 RidA family protein [Candidatus Saccharicenans sp.]
MKKAIKTDQAPKAIGPYSQGIMAGGFIFVSGQIPLDPVKGEIVGQTIEEQAHQVFKNLRAILQAAGSSLNEVVKATVFLADMNDFSRMNEVYAQYFSEPYPARAAFQVARLPREAKIEVEVIALAEAQATPVVK